MRKKIISVLLIALLLLSSMVLAACKKNADADAVAEEEVESVDIDDLIEEAEGEDDFEADDSDDPAYENETDGVELVEIGHVQEDFYGSWSAKSQLAHHLFGNADFTINEDGTWKGNVVDEDFKGKWTYEDEALYIRSDDGLINYKLFYVEDGSLMFLDQDNPDMVALVLKKQ